MGIELHFDRGTLILKGLSREDGADLKGVRWDPRTDVYRTEAYRYRSLLMALARRRIDCADLAIGFEPIRLPIGQRLEPHPFQREALRAWVDSDCRGVVVMPTGAGKTILAALAIGKCGMPTLVHVPTIDLMHQWYEVLAKWFNSEIGLLGGGYNDPLPITVATYDSALIHVAHRGNRYGLAVFDECHHLPGDQYKYVAVSAIAPFRLGLTATPEREDGREGALYELVGEICYRSHIHDLAGSTLAPYDVVTLQVELSGEERRTYEEARSRYLGFLRRKRINVGSPSGWQKFLWATRSPEGKDAFKAYRVQKKLSLAAEAKLHKLWDLLQSHRGDRILIFTQENEMAYQIGRMYFLPVLTHLTKVRERRALLDSFRAGSYSVLVTSKVLNEGVDVPEANVAVILSGSGSVREHVQRLGRILRSRPGKRAVLYEVVTGDTGEQWVNERRRRHAAYRRR